MNLELRQTGTFEKDVKKLDAALKSRLKKAIEKIVESPQGGKPLKHLPNIFSERIENFRLIYRASGNEILLVAFKNREQVYEFLREHY